MPAAHKDVTVSVGGLGIATAYSETGDGSSYREITLPAGVSGSLTTRTDDDTGIATLGSGHGITDSDVVDIHWSGGVRYGMTVTGYDGTTITVDGGAGDVLPAQSTALVATIQVEIDFPQDGDEITAIAVVCDQDAHLDFQESDTTSIYALSVSAGVGWDWFYSSGVANPLTGNACASIFATNGSTTAATLKIGYIYDATP